MEGGREGEGGGEGRGGGGGKHRIRGRKNIFGDKYLIRSGHKIVLNSEAMENQQRANSLFRICSTFPDYST